VFGQLGWLQGATSGDGVDRRTTAIARHQNTVELAGNAATACPAATLARLAVERARAFLRFEQK